MSDPRRSSWGHAPFFTVVTPTYQRAHLLPRVYRSLVEQSFSRFEWVVLDDGSTDETAELVASWLEAASKFPIRFLWQPNSGKHVAINRGVREARGELFVVVDSDDWLRPEALERIHWAWCGIPGEIRDDFVGVAGLCAHPSGEIVGSPFPCEYLDSNSVEIRTKHGVRGDNFGANRVDVLLKYPYPEVLGQFVPDSLVWYRIARSYRIRFVNEIWSVRDYQPGGISATNVARRVQSPAAAQLYYEEFVKIDDLHIPLRHRVRASANFVRFALHGGRGFRWQYRRMAANRVWWLAIPVGLLLFLKDRVRLARREKRNR